MYTSCKTCGRRTKSPTGLCKSCKSVCACGAPKDFRAEQCRSCAYSVKAKLQWQRARETLMAGIRRGQKRRRTRYEDVSLETKWQKRKDGRRWAWYWDGEEKHTIYRYRWVWTEHNGVIPDGMVLHHINGDCSDDRIENLEMRSRVGHLSLHAQAPDWGLWQDQRQPLWICLNCGREFRRSLRKRDNGYREPKYCSVSCCTEGRRNRQPRWICQNCGKEFRRLLHKRNNGYDEPKYCSRSCCTEGRKKR